MYADFHRLEGLRPGSAVRLAGVEAGRVKKVEFQSVRYGCRPLTEDLGRWGNGRSDDCEDALFCAPTGECGVLEPFAGRGNHPHCITSDDCAAEEICVTSDFRSRWTHVEWSGLLGVCARYRTEHTRTRVTMSLQLEALEILRADARATVTSASILGGQLVDISPGRAAPLGDQRRILTRPSIWEDVDRLRRRVDRFTEKAEDSIQAFVNVVNELQDPAVLFAVKGLIQNSEAITDDLASNRGLLGSLIGQRAYKEDLGHTLSELRQISAELEEAIAHADAILQIADRNSKPLLNEVRRVLQELELLLAALDSPTNRSLLAKLLRDSEGRMTQDLSVLLASVRDTSMSTYAVTRAIERGTGTLGKLINDPVVRDQLTRLLNNLAHHDVIRALAIFALDRWAGTSIREAKHAGRAR